VPDWSYRQRNQFLSLEGTPEYPSVQLPRRLDKTWHIDIDIGALLANCANLAEVHHVDQLDDIPRFMRFGGEYWCDGQVAFRCHTKMDLIG
jgi:hypothetical protein